MRVKIAACFPVLAWWRRAVALLLVSTALTSPTRAQVGLVPATAGAEALMGRYESEEKTFRLHLRLTNGMITGVLVAGAQTYEASAVKTADGLAGEFGQGFETWPFTVAGDSRAVTFTARKVTTTLVRKPLVFPTGTYRSTRVVLELERRGNAYTGVLRVYGREQPVKTTVVQDVFAASAPAGSALGAFGLVDTAVIGQVELRAASLRETLTFEAPRELHPPRRIPDLAMTLVWIAEGRFSMGSTNGNTNEQPLTRVELSQGFWMGNSEVTQNQWTTVMGTTFAEQRDRATTLNDTAYSTGGLSPMSYVSWADAVEFCRRLTMRERDARRLPQDFNYTLPTEAQWEYACRAGTSGDYAGPIDQLGWHRKNSSETIQTVRTRQANAWGIFDLHGNVQEWCSDWLSARLPGGSVTDFTGVPTGNQHVVRGGSATQEAWRCRSAARLGTAPETRSSQIGFRVVLTKTGEPTERR